MSHRWKEVSHPVWTRAFRRARRSLQELANKILEPEVQRYYAKRQEEFEQAQVRRLSAPFAVPTEDGRPLDRTAVKSEMELLRNRAVAGDDFDQLQRGAYKHLHIQASPPANALVVRRSDLQGEEAKTFDLSPGEVSAVLDLPGAYAFVKFRRKQIMPIELVRQQIETALRREGMQDAITKLGKRVSAQFNLQLRRQQMAVRPSQDVSPAELQQAKALLLRQNTLIESSEETVASGFVGRAAICLPLDEPTPAAQRYYDSTAAEIRAALEKWIHPEAFVRVVRGPAPK